METQVNSVEHTQEENGQNHYMELVAESNSVALQRTTNNIGPTQSQKKRRRFIPFKYHSRIFKASKKKHHVDDHRISTNSSSYASCKTYKKDSAKSNVSSHTYLDIEECRRHIELERCNSIATETSFSDLADRRTLDKDVHGIRKANANNPPKIQYQMELPKKTSRHAKKYMVIFCMVLVCAILSAAIASVFSTRSLRDSLPSDVEDQLSSGQFLSNVSNEDVMNRMDGLKNDLEDFSNKIKMSIDLFSLTLPNKTDFDGWIKESISIPNRIIQAMRCKDKCLDDMYGDYQYCFDCEKFITCLHNGTTVINDCAPTHPDQKIYWDDFERRCLFKSRTCHPSYTFPEKEN